jgi:hypothetical protein
VSWHEAVNRDCLPPCLKSGTRWQESVESGGGGEGGGRRQRSVWDTKREWKEERTHTATPMEEDTFPFRETLEMRIYSYRSSHLSENIF